MLKKSKIFLLAAVLILAFSQVAFPALTALGPVIPDADGNPLTPPWSAGFNGFPSWYRDSLGQTVTLSVPPAAVSIPDPTIPGNAFSQQIGFGSEAMYWHSTATVAVPGGQALLVLALEAAFGGGDAAPGDQIVFARVRIRIDTAQAGTYTVTYPYGTKTYNNVPVGTRAINDTVDVGLGAPGDFTGALSGEIGPFLKQVGAPAGTLGDATTLAQVTGSPTTNNFFRVVGPGVNVTQNLFVTGAQLFRGTPFNITRATFSRDGGGNAAAEIFATVPAPFTAGTIIRAVIPGQDIVSLTRSGLQFFGRVPFTAAFTPNITVRGITNGNNRTNLPATLVDLVTVTTATYAVGTSTLSLAAVSSDAQATLTASGWVGAGAGQALPNGVGVTTFSAPIAPDTVRVVSSSGGVITIKPIILP